MKNILVLGGVSYNTMIYLEQFPPPQPQTVFSQGFHETVGSTGAGKALNLARLGFDVTLHGMIGEDEYGRKIRNHFANANINFLYDTDPAGTKRHVNLMDENGRRISIFISYGTHEPDVDWARLEPLIAGADLVALNIVNYCRHAIPLIKKHGKEIWCDIHTYDGQEDYHRDFIDAADVLFFSSEDMPDYRSFMERQIADGKKYVVATHGKDGSTALTAANEWLETPIIPTYNDAKTDTNGAGDAIFAGTLAGYANNLSIADSLRWGTIAAGMCVTNRELAHPDLSLQAIRAACQRHYRNA
ncbi:MAG: carbohydrate kinase family protein [Chloroflexi bacterium]|nr:carbohydrate kinase family protein [Chloroflexota bacterium]